MPKTVQRQRKKVYAIEKVPEEESPTEDSESDSMGDAIREQYDEEKDPRVEFPVDYQEETPLEIQHIQLEAGIPQDTAKKTCENTHRMHRHSWSHQPKESHAYMGQPQNDWARNYLDNHFPNWEKQLLPTKAKSFKSASGMMTSIQTIIKEIIIPHRKGNIRINTELVVRDDAHIQGFLLGTD
ncbi:hypothetical protein O181_092813 [Austropuccinia psidii MF-1]|uniref:Uncharacterized protein n=1 Tax=Austropuccinia psidii MF-1 TaxID=1389203 RepID=A0A9Q3P8T3_9BASI|nr:hypothetical protein [Austropuccinia psidii MF-1]